MTIEEPINSEPDVICASEADPNFVPGPTGYVATGATGYVATGATGYVATGATGYVENFEEDSDSDSSDQGNSYFEEVPDTEIFFVTEDGVPIFYASDMETAVKQLEDYLVYKIDYENNRDFFVDHISETEYHICSRNDYFVVNFDCVEYVYKIDTISKVRNRPVANLP